MSDSSLRTLLGGSVVLFGGMVCQLVLGFIARIVTARYLSPAEYGAIGLGISLVTFFGTLSVLGVDMGVARFLPRYDDSRSTRGVLVSAFRMSIPVAVLVSAVTVLFPARIASVLGGSGAAGVIRVFGLMIPIAALLRLTVGSIRGLQLATPRVYAKDIALPLTRLVLIFAVIAVGGTVFDIALAYLAAYVIATAIAFVYLGRHTAVFDVNVPSATMYRDLLLFSAPLLVSSMTYQMFTNVDVFLLGYFTGSTASIGVYQVVYPLSQLLTVFLGPVGFMILPIISELDSERNEDEIRRVYRVAVKWVFLFMLPVCLTFVLFPETIISYTFGEKYAVAGPTLAVLSLAFFTHSMAGPNAEALTSIGESRLIMYDNIIVALANVGLNVVLIPHYSYFGAAVATALSFCLLNVIVTVQLYRRVGIRPVSLAVLRIGAIGALVFVATWVVTRQFDLRQVVTMLITTAVFVPAYAVIVIRFGITREELALFETVENRFNGKLQRIRRQLRHVSRRTDSEE
ncbi:flippase [Haladaptatus halobius]|uniref:flippase n=1 Tax=Haladaptatus halobius TaxID=2884875 RepID=UPI001D0AB734|nr:flippase [Haladaptatus halobius]